ncbi:MAG: PAS domain S-box protein [Verrucomicrobiales bacterium]|nr:PAS domain S-box protein [Verrucomicrobiales bacterium]
MILLNLVQNLALLVALAAAHQVLLTRWSPRRLPYQCISGLLFGAAALVVMLTPVTLAPGVIFDGRTIILSTAGLFGGPLTAALAAVPAAVYRLWLGGSGAAMGVTTIVSASALGVLFHYLRRRRTEPPGAAWYWSFSLLVHVSMLAATVLLPAELWRTVWREIAPALLTVYPLAGLLVCLLFADYEKRQEALEALRASERRRESILRSIGDAVIATDRAGRVELLNPVAEKLTGWTLDEARGRPLEEIFQIFNEETRQPAENPVARVLREGTVVGLANHTLLRARDGREIPIADAGAPIRDPVGDMTGGVLVFRNQTAERAAQRALAEAREFAENIVATLHESLLVLDAELRVVSANRSFYQTFGLSPENTVGRAVYELGGREWDVPELRQLLEQVLPQNTQFNDYELTRSFSGLGRRTMVLNARRLHGEKNRTQMILLAIQDVTEHRRAEEALAAVREREHHLSELISDYAYTFRVESDGRMIGQWLSESFTRTFGYTMEEIEARGGWQTLVHPDDLAHALAHARKVLSGHRDICEMRFLTRRGEARWLRDHAAPIFDATGRVVRIHGAAQDITQQRRLEEELRQAQKLEAIGQLAGGVAHDFNNILAVMMMQAELTALNKDLPAEVQEALRQIHAAARRAANLTRQLLLFSRRQILQVEDLELNRVVRDMGEMLQRLLGETIHLELRLHPHPLPLRADAGMLDQVLLNLAVNARDAMPQGGELRIETFEHLQGESDPIPASGVAPGRYARVRVSDTGQGIAPDILPRIFEPFFSTKEPGRGTGLGLATVYGIVKQHRGWITVQSTPGHGTQFEVFLPLSERAASPTETPAAPRPLPGGRETILLVEDDPAVRQLTRMTLERRGYRVLAAAQAEEALALWEQHSAEIALLLTDVVMPGKLSGIQLARRLQAERPGLRVLFMSGYSAEWAGREAELQPGEKFLPKPCPPEDLLRVVRASLDA